MRHDILKSGCGFRLLQSAARHGRQAASRTSIRFKRTRRGAVALFVALGIIPLITFVGLAVDTTRGYLVKSRLNQALDAIASRFGNKAVVTADLREDDPDDARDGFSSEDKRETAARAEFERKKQQPQIIRED